MPDVFTKAKRSEVMSRIRGLGNKDTELALIRVFRSQRITGWRRQVGLRLAMPRPGRAFSGSGRRGKILPVVKHEAFRCTPDFVFPKLRLAVFVDGCFWHGCPRHATQPKNNAAFWRTKLAANQARDRLVHQTLRARGWKVLRLWEHDLAPRNAHRLLRRLHSCL